MRMPFQYNVRLVPLMQESRVSMMSFATTADFYADILSGFIFATPDKSPPEIESESESESESSESDDIYSYFDTLEVKKQKRPLLPTTHSIFIPGAEQLTQQLYSQGSASDESMGSSPESDPRYEAIFASLNNEKEEPPFGSLIVAIPPVTGMCDIYSDYGARFQMELGNNENQFMQIQDPRLNQGCTYLTITQLATQYLDAILRTVQPNQPIVLTAYSSSFALALEIYKQFRERNLLSEHFFKIEAIDPTPQDFFKQTDEQLARALGDIVFNSLYGINTGCFTNEQIEELKSIFTKVRRRVLIVEQGIYQQCVDFSEFADQLYLVIHKAIISFCKLCAASSLYMNYTYTMGNSVQLKVILANFLALYEWSSLHQKNIILDENLSIISAEGTVEEYEKTNIHEINELKQKNIETSKLCFSLGWLSPYNPLHQKVHVECIAQSTHQTIFKHVCVINVAYRLARVVAKLDCKYLQHILDGNDIGEDYKMKVTARLSKLLPFIQQKSSYNYPSDALRIGESLKAYSNNNLGSPLFSSIKKQASDTGYPHVPQETTLNITIGRSASTPVF
jgi:hypothetical protein